MSVNAVTTQKQQTSLSNLSSLLSSRVAAADGQNGFSALLNQSGGSGMATGLLAVLSQSAPTSNDAAQNVGNATADTPTTEQLQAMAQTLPRAPAPSLTGSVPTSRSDVPSRKRDQSDSDTSSSDAANAAAESALTAPAVPQAQTQTSGQNGDNTSSSTASGQQNGAADQTQNGTNAQAQNGANAQAQSALPDAGQILPAQTAQSAQSAQSPGVQSQAAQLSQMAGNTAGSVSSRSGTDSSQSAGGQTTADLSSGAALTAQAVDGTAQQAANGQGGGGSAGQDSGNAAGQQAAAAQTQGGDAAAAAASGTTAPAQSFQAALQSAAKDQGGQSGVVQAAGQAGAAQAAGQLESGKSGAAALAADANATSAGGLQNTSFAQRLSAAQGTQTLRPATLPSAAEQVKVQIDKAAATGSNTISIVLHPEELGRVEVKLEMQDGGQVKATVTADNAATLQTLKNDSQGLQQSLQNAGLSTTPDALSFQLQSGQQGWQRQQQSGGGNSGNGGGTVSPVLADTGTAEDATVQAVQSSWSGNPADGLDIRI